jgi:glutaminyl-peptide cyclotransferase
MKRRLILLLLSVLVLVGCGIVWMKRSASPSNGALGKAAYEHTRAILEVGPRPPGSEGLAKVRAYVKAELEKSGWSVQEHAFDRTTPIGTVRFVNLRARFSGKAGDPWARVPEGLLCAHIDSKLIEGIEFLGADDAASACAAIVEIARYLSSNKPEQAEKMELVFFDGEESFGESITNFDGLYGSRAYAGIWRNQPQKPRFGIVLDMIGHKNLKIAMPSDSPEFLKDHVLAAAKEEQAAKHFSMARVPITDDHVPLNQIAIPTIDIIGDFATFKWWHHQHGEADDLSIISAESLDTSMRVTVRTLDRLFAPIND